MTLLRQFSPSHLGMDYTIGTSDNNDNQVTLQIEVCHLQKMSG